MQRLIWYPACACVMAAIVVHYSSTSSEADSPEDAAEWPGHKRVRKAAWMAAVGALPCGRRRPHSRPLCNARGRREEGLPTSAALADLARLRTCAGPLASAWLPARPGPAKLATVEGGVSARLRLGEDLLAGQNGDTGRVCGGSMTAGSTQCLTCGALWHNFVACHNAMPEAWLRIAARGQTAATCAPHGKHRPQRPE